MGVESAAIEFKTVIDVVTDAFTGGILEGKFSRCGRCACCYGPDSVQAIQEHNSGQCIGCGAPITGLQPEQPSI